MRKITIVFVIALLMLSINSFTQNVAVTDDDLYSADPSAILDVKSTTKGLLIPRLTTVERTGMSIHATGLLVFDTDVKSFYFWDGLSWINLSKGQIWTVNSDYVFLTDVNDRVGIGTSTPKSKLEVKADASFTIDDTLFVVKDKEGNPVFAVFSDGVKILVPYGTKGKVGGFAISGRTPTKEDEPVDYFRVTPDSTRIYVNDSLSTKGKVGGFAISGRTPTKGSVKEYFSINKDSTRIYINDSLTTKGRVGGFAISGRTPTKGSGNEYLFVNSDSTRIYVKDTSSSKGTVGGFAVSGRTPTKGEAKKFMDMTKENYFIGHNSGSKNISGKYNSFVGYESGRSNDHGANNVFLGFMSGYTNSGGNNNTFLGHMAGYSNSTGSNNVFLGDSSGFTNSVGEQNIFLGNASGKANTGGNYNAFIGFRAGQKNTIGKNNSFIGYQAGYTNESGNNNSFIGNSAGWWTYKGSKNVFIGYKSGYLNYGTQEGTVFGGNNNIYIGDSTGYKNRTGYNNVFIGTNAGAGSPDYLSSKSVFNVYIGYRAGYNDYEGDKNVCIGYQAGYWNKTADYQVFIGESAGFKHSTGNDNLFIGYGAGINHESGASNVFLGANTGISNVTGVGNVFIGNLAGRYETGSNKLFIDNQTRTNEAISRTNSLIYGEFNATTTSQVLRINGKVGILLAANPTEALEVNGNVKATSFIATTASTGAYKYNTTLNMTVPDYVFDKHFDGNSILNPFYEMLSLSELRIFITTNRHLPRVPSRAEIEKDGIVNLQALSMITLEKVEENTLYILDLEKNSTNQKHLIQQQTTEINALKTKINENEKRIRDLELIVNEISKRKEE
jgi:trimeric autotransporter adhesin